MKKWQVTIETTIQAEERSEAWRIAAALMEKHLRGLATVMSVSREPVADPQGWIAINEPIRSKV